MIMVHVNLPGCKQWIAGFGIVRLGHVGKNVGPVTGGVFGEKHMHLRSFSCFGGFAARYWRSKKKLVKHTSKK